MISTLRAAPLGHRLVVTALAVHDVAGSRRLVELGLRPGAPVRSLSRTAGGGRVVDVSGARVAVGRDILELITVVEVHEVGVAP